MLSSSTLFIEQRQMLRRTRRSSGFVSSPVSIPFLRRARRTGVVLASRDASSSAENRLAGNSENIRGYGAGTQADAQEGPPRPSFTARHERGTFPSALPHIPLACAARRHCQVRKRERLSVCRSPSAFCHATSEGHPRSRARHPRSPKVTYAVASCAPSPETCRPSGQKRASSCLLSVEKNILPSPRIHCGSSLRCSSPETENFSSSSSSREESGA